MDGPDGWFYYNDYNNYWRDLRKDEKTLCKKPYGSGGVMVWNAFSNLRQVCFIFCSLKMDQDEYIKALDENLLEYYIYHNKGTWRFLHDNSPINYGYGVKQSKLWISLLAYNDRNPIENL